VKYVLIPEHHFVREWKCTYAEAHGKDYGCTPEYAHDWAAWGCGYVHTVTYVDPVFEAQERLNR
jgi:hypothetical protein